MSGIATAIIASAVIVGGVSYYEGEKQRKQIKNAAEDAQAANDKALADAQAARDLAAKQAEAAVENKRRAVAGSNTVFTNPLGLQDQALTIKKTMLGQ